MRIPVKALREFAKALGLKRAILFAWDGKLHHVVTWGDTVEGCSQAADFGNKLKEALGWPDSLQSQPSRVKQLEKEIRILNNALVELSTYCEGSMETCDGWRQQCIEKARGMES